MALQSGSRVGSYEIISLLGEGGMGQVYRARDTKLHRDVALKILPDRMAADADRLARFRREAQVLASLNHPNIAALHGVEEWEGHQALVMELVPGRTLAEIIDAESPLAPDAAVHIASQIADALEAAHEAGVIHRDLKPANVKRRDDDVVKVLDFGLARAIDPDGSARSGSGPSSPTMVSPAVTQPGVVLGTAGYMSPEQARGRLADKRADIWAFGVVLFEMLTGRRLFAGETVTEVISAVIKDAPRLDALPANTPPALRHLIARCLERDPRLRLRDIGEARILLRTALSPDDPLNRAATPGPVVETARPRPAVAPRVLVSVGVLALAGLAGLLAWNMKPDGDAVPVRRFDLPSAFADTNEAALAPDGSRIAFPRAGHLYVHTLQTGKTTDLGAVPAGTEGVFWSPDSQTIAYGAESTLRTVPAAGGVPFIVCKVPASGRLLGSLWRDDGVILFAVWRDSLYQVAATGGTPTLRVAIDAKTEIDFHSITSLPGDRLIVTTHLRGEDASRADLVDGDRRTPLSNDPGIANVLVVPPNQFLFLRIRTNQGVWTAPFDGRVVDFSKAVLVEPGAQYFDVTADGTLMASIPAKVRRELVWVTRSGAVTPLPGATFEWGLPAVVISNDGRRAVLSTRTSDGKDEFVVRDLATGTDTRLPSPTPPTGVASFALVTWTPSGRLLYGAGGVEASKVYDWPADGSASGRELVAAVSAQMTHDGKELVFTQELRGRFRLLRAPVLADGAIGSAVPVFPGDSDLSVRWFDLSRDGRLLAFTSTDPVTSQYNVSVATYPDLRERRQVTAQGGTQPRFSPDGRALYYLSGVRTPDRIMRGLLNVVAVTTPPLAIGAPTVLLKDGDTGAGSDRPLALIGFDVASDGRLLMTRVVPAAPGDEARLMILQNWRAAIGR